MTTAILTLILRVQNASTSVQGRKMLYADTRYRTKSVYNPPNCTRVLLPSMRTGYGQMVRRIATSATQLWINGLSHDISYTDRLCGNCGGDSSTGEEEVSEHDTELVMSSAQDHPAKETVKSLSDQQSNGTQQTEHFQFGTEAVSQM